MESDLAIASSSSSSSTMESGLAIASSSSSSSTMESGLAIASPASSPSPSSSPFASLLFPLTMGSDLAIASSSSSPPLLFLSTMDSDKGVLLPWIHKHLMVPWNSLEKGRCCGRSEAITDGYHCEECDFFVHKKCSESPAYIQHPSHSDHTLWLQSRPNGYCDLCGRRTVISYNCETCEFDVDLYCAKYPPPEVMEVSETHRHTLTLLKKRTKFDCGANCGKIGNYDEFPYECDECELFFHIDCVWHPPEAKHTLEFTTMDTGERVSLPWIHKHLMLPWNDTRKGDCCGRNEAITHGYFCKRCDFFVHKKCGDDSPKSIQHPSHSLHPLWLQITSNAYCDLCGKAIVDLSYSCKICGFNIDLFCVEYPPPEVIGNSEMHPHKLTLLKKRIDFDCDAKCGKSGEKEFLYKCDECEIAFHVDCLWHPPEVKHPLEVNHSYHSLHPLKLHMGLLPDYSDGRCRLCGRKIDDRLFYHCSSCNFTLDMRCVLHPPPQSLLDLKAHDHRLTLLPRLDSFTCNACGLKGDRSRYVCFQCGFTIHQDCLGLPRVININRHGHRVSRTSLLGVVNSVCGVCREKVDWIYGGYSCQRCPDYVVHSKCATRKDVWNGKELEGVPEEMEDVEPYEVIDENTIQHFSHKEHYLRLHVNGVSYEENKRCRACCHPIGLQYFYGCIDCEFVLHQYCAELRRRKWHVLHNEQLTLAWSETDCFWCDACHRVSNGFMYKHGNVTLDVRCSSISEPYVHPSHPHHPLYYIPPNNHQICSGCNKRESYVLRCIEDGCEFVLGFECATLPQVIKHRVHDHPLSLCYGEEGASGKYWCDICEKESDPKTWFYTCKDRRASLHTKCVLGDFSGLMPRNIAISWEAMLNNSVTRPFCRECKSRCIHPIIVKDLGTLDAYICSKECMIKVLESIGL
ncbi:hypothetical protein AALP_AA6G035300 [Arabis alpina]|uniref:Phorbol-ester/DAG-type domain-containing protein n=1 Tax=Arabis alpina TaxID=50452 RepID=A0A087GLW1_ARAAL|nr:hypothetical protein AALP_AA6G035300 [Arabis alpina]